MCCILKRMNEVLEQLRKALDGHSQLLIIPHNDPDPDAIAAAIGLDYLVREKFGIDALVRFSGIIGRAENKALVHYLNNPLEVLDPAEINPDIPIALVDTQPGAVITPFQRRSLPGLLSTIISGERHPPRSVLWMCDRKLGLHQPS